MGKRKIIGKSSYSSIKNKKYKKKNDREVDESQENVEEGITNVYSSERTRQRKSKLEQFLKMKAFSYNPETDYEFENNISIGLMDNECTYCQALKYRNEPTGLCCANGKIKLPVPRCPVEPLLSYLIGNTSDSKEFKNNIRSYNSCFQMTSFGSNRKKEPGYNTTFRIQGQIYHRIGSLLPVDNNPSFLQIYFLGDNELQVERRCTVVPKINKEIVSSLQKLLHEHNVLIKIFKNSLEKIKN